MKNEQTLNPVVQFGTAAALTFVLILGTGKMVDRSISKLRPQVETVVPAVACMTNKSMNS
ncbi:hypothetical protein [Parachitinimonas caeni]|uniref:Uncharacterized protein n=1 Tax=Parachitinimonas caeni TaxID=3031301 RepID=A0ABT7DY47_9NEIS|nr:hypothetical protein [Parachitinimonas caeni]MDK2124982.1 hypothetical protein [Parachitinimonas caeni]